MYYLLPYQYTAHWLLLCQGIMMLLSYTIVDFHLFYDGPVDIQIWAPLTRSQCKVSDTQVNIKACRPLVSFAICYGFLRLLTGLFRISKYTDSVENNLCLEKQCPFPQIFLVGDVKQGNERGDEKNKNVSRNRVKCNYY